MEFANGIYYNEPSEKVKEWSFGKLSINVENFTKWIKSQDTDEKGNIKLKIVASKKTGKPYIAIDDWKPTLSKKEIKIEELPF